MIKTIFTETIKTLTNPWVLFGLFSQGVFFMRFIVQWWESEKNKKVVVPMAFWYLSIGGTVLTLIYSIHIHDFVFITASILSFFIYFRNIAIHNKEHKAEKDSIY